MNNSKYTSRQIAVWRFNREVFLEGKVGVVGEVSDVGEVGEVGEIDEEGKVKRGRLGK